jgi:Mce-associated membrane protein
MWQEGETREGERAEVEAAAEGFVTALTNFSADTIEADATEIKSFAVGDFAEEVETFFGAEAIAAIKEAQAESTGEIESIFIQDISEDQASVFGVVSETVTNSTLTDPRSDVLRLEIGMIRTAAEWKVNRVDVFQAPGTGLAPAP